MYPVLDPGAEFRDWPSLVAEHARRRPGAPALTVGERELDYAGLDALADRVAAALQREGLAEREVVAVCAASSIEYVALFVGALRAGLALAPLAPSATPAQIAAMAADCDARLVFVDAAVAAALQGQVLAAPLRRLDDAGFRAWLARAGTRPRPVAIAPDAPFNIIYSSGTTGAPKGIVQPHSMRWAHVRRAAVSGYGSDTVTLIATPLYSNTTLVVVVPTLAFGGHLVLMPRFDAATYLSLAARVRATHTMLVPVQYQRLMARPDFGAHDLSSFRFKFCTSAPFSAALKADVLARWPGALVEYYGMTEGGGTCILQAHLFPHKLHTVGQPAEGHDVRLVDEQGREVARGEVGEVVGRSPAMMSGYHGQPALTAAAEWRDGEGRRYIRTGDVGRFDEDGFLVLLDRRKDMVISGGFNIYPSDLEAVLRRHPAVADCAVVGIASAEWGETPVAWVVCAPGAAIAPEALREWANAQLGRTQRLAGLRYTDELPRSAIGKVLKRELREAWGR
ncbi:MAG: 4-coumarate--CoA ligase [Rubrivivax sp. SCN 70-15]|nr:MAG: 4-coumarate--CoA ligase [Rubrivivax sp. SCN 70-15]